MSLLKSLTGLVSKTQLKDILTHYANAINAKASKEEVYTKIQVDAMLKAYTDRLDEMEEILASSLVDINQRVEAMEDSHPEE